MMLVVRWRLGWCDTITGPGGELIEVMGTEDHATMYDQEDQPLFWESLEALDALGNPERIAQAVNILTTWAVQDPTRAIPGEKGVRVLKLPSTYILGGMTPPLRLAYYLDERPRPNGARGAVVLLHIGMYDEEEELLDGGIAPQRH